MNISQLAVPVQQSAPFPIEFCSPTQIVLTITASGELIAGPGMSQDEATKSFFEILRTQGISIFGELEQRLAVSESLNDKARAAITRSLELAEENQALRMAAKKGAVT